MSGPLDAYVAGRTPHAEMVVQWGDTRLRLRRYLIAEPPPQGLVTSVRAVVFRASKVAVIRQLSGEPHITPGGRIEPGETHDAALAREVLEECGWTLAEARPFAVSHFAHLTPKPPGYAYPYPDFLHRLYWARAGDFRRAALKRAGQIEAASTMMSVRAAMALLDDDQRAMLAAAIAARAAG